MDPSLASAPFWTFPAAQDHRPALIDADGRAITYADLSAQADSWRDRILSAAPAPSALLALEFETSVPAIAAYLGALRSGLPVLVVEPGQLAASAAIARAWRPDLVIAPQGGALHLRAQPSPEPAAEPIPAPHPDLRLLLSTSGSTGDPKLVRLSARNIDSNARAIADYLRVTPEDRAATTLPLFYSYGLSVLHSYLAAGATLALIPDSVSSPEFWAKARAARVTSLALVPHQFELLDAAAYARLDLPTLRYVTQAGGRLSPEIVRRAHAKGQAQGWDLVLMYGQTEAAPRISYVPPETLPEACDTIGRAIPGGRLRLLDSDGHEIAAPGQEGELVYDGPNVMMGYAERRADLARPPETPELRTGDLAELTPAGLVRITGRAKRFVKLYGLRLGLDRIESMLEGQGIAARAVAAGDRLVLLHADPAQGDAAIAAVIRAYDLPGAQIHAAPLGQVPLLPSGKVDQRALGLRAAEVVARDEAARQRQGRLDLREALQQATRAPQVGPDDSFVSLGGDSLSYLQMQLTLEEHLGHPPEEWERMTLAQLESLAAAPAAAIAPRTSRLGIDVLLRLGAITLIVGQHATSFPMYGGTWALILLIGVTLGRFQTDLLATGQSGRFALRMLYPIVPLYAGLTALYGVLKGGVPASYAVLLGNYAVFTDTSSAIEPYWFVSLYAQLVVVVALLALLPPVRRTLATRPWAVAAGLLAAAFALLGALLAAVPDALSTMPVPHHPPRDLLMCLPVLALGWMIQSAASRGQRIATALAALAAWGAIAALMAAPGPRLVLAAAILLLLWSPRLTVPRVLGQLLQRLASATLFVYLLHVVVIVGTARLPVPEIARLALTLGLSFPLAVAVKAAFDRLDRLGPPKLPRRRAARRLA